MDAALCGDNANVELWLAEAGRHSSSGSLVESVSDADVDSVVTLQTHHMGAHVVSHGATPQMGNHMGNHGKKTTWEN